MTGPFLNGPAIPFKNGLRPSPATANLDKLSQSKRTSLQIIANSA